MVGAAVTIGLSGSVKAFPRYERGRVSTAEYELMFTLAILVANFKLGGWGFFVAARRRKESQKRALGSEMGGMSSRSVDMRERSSGSRWGSACLRLEGQRHATCCLLISQGILPSHTTEMLFRHFFLATWQCHQPKSDNSEHTACDGSGTGVAIATPTTPLVRR